MEWDALHCNAYSIYNFFVVNHCKIWESKIQFEVYFLCNKVNWNQIWITSQSEPKSYFYPNYFCKNIWPTWDQTSLRRSLRPKRSCLFITNMISFVIFNSNSKLIHTWNCCCFLWFWHCQKLPRWDWRWEFSAPGLRRH